MLQVPIKISLESSVAEKGHGAMQKKRELKKMVTKMFGVLKTIGTKMPTLKKEKRRRKR